MSTKTNKSYSKRIKVTKTGKLKARKAGHGHFNAKQKRRKQLQAKTLQDVNMSNKDVARFLPHSK